MFFAFVFLASALFAFSEAECPPGSGTIGLHCKLHKEYNQNQIVRSAQLARALILDPRGIEIDSEAPTRETFFFDYTATTSTGQPLFFQIHSFGTTASCANVASVSINGIPRPCEAIYQPNTFASGTAKFRFEFWNTRDSYNIAVSYKIDMGL
ncbi:hypothetical protein L596_017006 [Steinernema carpocapsae]|uniref:Reelin domain-containing protein n=1 Tax=Steinernema carpocapsae TaxID=34508 RepID=A0A4U5N135_STECR|nr:hypothetical protein L596_017006 [Steinernema carpocapsae]